MIGRSLKSVVRRARGSLASIRAGQSSARLEHIDFQSGLGDSAFLLYGLVKSAKPNVVVEIGSARGRSTCLIGKALKENGRGTLHAIDPHTATAWNDSDSIDTYEVLLNNIDRCGVRDHVKVLRNTSSEAAANWTLPIDMIFIDGDHSYDSVKRDWQLFSPFVKPFGIAIFHDTLWDLKPDERYQRPDMGVPRFVEELREKGYPVLTIDRDFGVSVVQPVRHGVALRRETDAAEVEAVEVSP